MRSCIILEDFIFRHNNSYNFPWEFTFFFGANLPIFMCPYIYPYYQNMHKNQASYESYRIHDIDSWKEIKKKSSCYQDFYAFFYKKRKLVYPSFHSFFDNRNDSSRSDRFCIVIVWFYKFWYISLVYPLFNIVIQIRPITLSEYPTHDHKDRKKNKKEKYPISV